MLISKALVITLLCALCNAASAVRILGIFPFAATSHYILGNALMKGLAEAGHNVTMVSPFEEKHPPKAGSYRDVVLTGFSEEYKKMLKIMNLLNNKNQTMMESFLSFRNIMQKLNDDIFNCENVQKLLKSNEKFDVVIVEQFLNDAVKIFGYHYNVPVIAFSTIGANPWVNEMVGNPAPLSYIPLLDTGLSWNMSFFERLSNIFAYVVSGALQEFFFYPLQNKILRKHFTDPPDVHDLYHNVSLVLLNSHESLNQPVPFVPNMIQIGGFHVQPPKKLPRDLQEYLDNAKEGVVYFSMGSNLRSKHLPPYKRDAFLKAFSKLKEKVLWKWEDDELPGKPTNVKLSKWLPQQDILAHPNVKLFITHSGLLSTTEAVYHGVPILGIPVFGDQHMNSLLAVHNGYALRMPYEDPSFSEEKLSEMLQELLTNPKYMENVKRRSKIFHDRPMKPMETAAYWVEYVVRNGGAAHLRVAGVDLPWYRYHSLDVISFILVLSSLVIHLLYLGFTRILSCWGICDKGRSKAKND